MFAGLGSSFQSLIAQPALLAMGAGVLAGAITGTTLVVTGILPERPDPVLSIMSCYQDGREIARAPSGVSMLVTAQSPDGTWLEVFVGVPGADRGWVPASALKVGTSTASLNIIQCVGIIPFGSLGPPATPATPGPSAEPSAAPPSIVATVVPTISLAPGATPTPTPRATRTARPSVKPSAGVTPLPPPPTTPPTPTPSTNPDFQAPSITSFVITSPGAFNGSYFIGDLPCSLPSATIHATVTDPAGLNFVRLYYRPSGMSQTFGTMTPIGNNVYSFTITPPQSWPSGEIGLWVQAQDGLGNTSSQIPFGNPNSTLDSSLFWDPICIT